MSRLALLAAAPHRMLFLAGMAIAAGGGAWWLLELAARAWPLALPAGVAPQWLHGWLMLYGAVGAFIFGFLFTTFPRWQDGPPVPRAAYAGTFALLLAGAALGLAALWQGAAWLVAGILLGSAAWALGWGALLWVMLCAQRIVAHAVVAALALGVGLVAQLALALALLQDAAGLAHAALRIALWGCLLPLTYAVCHRMLPFFSQGVITGYQAHRPFWRLVAVTALCALHVLLAISGAYGWLWLADLPLAWLLLASGLRWEPLKSRGVPLLWTLYVAYLWLPLGVALQAVADLGYAWTGQWWLGRAPLHALGIGFMMSLILAMATRVTLGHSGRRLWMDRLTLACFALLQAAALLRVGSELLPAGGWTPAILLASAALWLAAFLPWAARYGPVYLQPRVDGRPG